ncbi:MATE family efflux transporter [Aliiglaciecola sp. CAU 1673]|uniref:MATE family efflux transporter n=1 Tax=Aliiglaciecola sp. CAU 1673 TaxID=3032595 RepID=UPI0023DBF010|nr:MATE family efflux transporter [Aliiglaciecola sp. CAU 1673]MDF2179248.1 MATE family efflux transporter [Aliiglaciecola sp. CAU 1673]
MSIKPRNSFFSALLERHENKRILAIAFPMVLSNLSNPLLGMVDTAIVGHMQGVHFLAGTAVASMLVSQLYWLCGFLRMSATGLSAQALGRGDKQAAAKSMYQLLAPALLLGMLLIVAAPLLIITAIAFSDATAQSAPVIDDYLSVRLWGAPAALANLMLMGWLIGQQAARTVMTIQILANLLNAGLSLLLVLGLGWGVKGVAAATVCAEWGIFIAGLWLTLRRLNGQKPQRAWFRIKNYRSVLALNVDILMRNLALQITLAFMVFQGARLGEETVALNAVLMQFFVILALGLDGIAYAVEALCGESKGRGDGTLLVMRISRGLFWSLVLAMLYCLIFILFGKQIITLLTDLESLRRLADAYLPYIWILPLIAHWCFLLDGVYIGLTQGKAMRNSMLISSLGVFFPVWWSLSGWGNHGLWLAFLGFLLSRGVTLGADLFRRVRQQRLLV